MTTHLEPVRLADLLKEVPGRWVAMHNGEIIEVRATLDELMLALQAKGTTDATVMRAPGAGEPELVGLG